VPHDQTETVSLSLGGNLGDVTSSFIRALVKLAETPGVALRRASSIYATPPWGKVDQPPFLNMAALIETSLSPHALLALCLAVEQEMGRVRRERWGPRTLDIDILTYGDQSIDTPDLKAPHPHLAERAFVLAPLAEIAPRLEVKGRDIERWLARADRTGVEVEPEATQRLREALQGILGQNEPSKSAQRQ
jgi:2-amino-4-hydroxy-6-hydroxymethyldihydropteridine diphosphokinase